MSDPIHIRCIPVLNDGHRKKGLDTSLTNKSSIVFTVTQDGKRILMTGDTEGWILENATKNQNLPLKWDIIKVLHHGSSNNNVLAAGTDPTLRECVAAFYTKFEADKYVISSDTWSLNPNPDLVGGILPSFGIFTTVLIKHVRSLSRVWRTHFMPVKGMPVSTSPTVAASKGQSTFPHRGSC